MNALLDVAQALVPMAPYCLPAEATNAMDTARFWAQLIAITAAIIALIMLGIGLFFSGRRGDGGEMLRSLAYWIGGVVLVSAASGIATIFLQTPTDCI